MIETVDDINTSKITEGQKLALLTRIFDNDNRPFVVRAITHAALEGWTYAKTMEALLELEDSMSREKPQQIAGFTNPKSAGNNNNKGSSNSNIRYCINFQKYNNCRRHNCTDVHKVDPNFIANNTQYNSNKNNNKSRDGNDRGGQDYRSQTTQSNRGILKNSIPVDGTHQSAVRFVPDKATIVQMVGEPNGKQSDNNADG